MASILVIYNPVAGRMLVKAMWPRVEQCMRDAGIDFHAIATRAPREAIELARGTAANYDAVVGVGGDGTMCEIVNGLLQASGERETLPFGLIPLGNGDDFAKVLPPEAAIGGKSFGWREAVQKVARRELRLYDAGRMRGYTSRTGSEPVTRYFLNGADAGFGAHTARNFTKIPRFLTGYPAYLAAVFKTMVNYPAVRLSIQLDHEAAFEQVTTMAAITNGRCFGNGFWVCPQAEPDDGLFDVMLAQQINRRTILGLLPKLRRGTHVEEAVVKMHRAQRVVLESDTPFFIEADGEIPFASLQRLDLEVLPKVLRIIV
jgi:YegS/Rv2252/BmrU family lipid kinase